MDELLRIVDVKKYFTPSQTLWERWISDSGAIYALDGVSFEVKKGETIGLLGESGSGKSTLGKTILGFYEPTAGEIFFSSECLKLVKRRDLQKIRLKMGYIFSDPATSLNPSHRIQDILFLPLVKKGMDRREITWFIDDILRLVGLGKEKRRLFPSQLKKGEGARVSIARALITNPSLVVVDDPLGGLDLSMKAQLLNLLEDLKGRMDLTYLFMSKDLSILTWVSQRIMVMYLGKIVEIASREDLLSSPSHPYTKALLSSFPVMIPKERKKERIFLEGSLASSLRPKRGCKFSNRCYMKERPASCFTRTPPLVEGSPGHFAACHLLV